MIPYSFFVALITPFTKSQEIDFVSFENLIKWHIQEGTEALVLCGSTGSGLLLSLAEEEELLRRAVKIAQGKIGIFMSTGAPSTHETLRKTRVAKELGADGCQIIIPYYVKATERGLWEHFSLVSEEGLPMMIYYHPGRTGATLSATFLEKLALLPSVAVKDSSGNNKFLKNIKAMYVGDDPLLIDYLEERLVGIVSVIGNLIPKEWKQVLDLWKAGNKEAAKRQFFKYKPLIDLIFDEVNPQGIQYAVSTLKRCHHACRLPLVTINENLQKKIYDEMQRLCLLKIMN